MCESPVSLSLLCTWPFPFRRNGIQGARKMRNGILQTYLSRPSLSVPSLHQLVGEWLMEGQWGLSLLPPEHPPSGGSVSLSKPGKVELTWVSVPFSITAALGRIQQVHVSPWELGMAAAQCWRKEIMSGPHSLPLTTHTPHSQIFKGQFICG